MHLLVLSAFRRCSRVSFHGSSRESQCTFWCSVLSDRGIRARRRRIKVSMHLLVLSAFRLANRDTGVVELQRLNAPSGAQCFPTSPRA